MKKELLRFTLYATVIYLTGGLLASAVASPAPLWGNGTHSHGHRDFKVPDNRNYARAFANLNVGEPRTVRLIYFLPNGRVPQPDIDAKMDALIKEAQQVFAGQMDYYGFGRKTFKFETDSNGKAVVHRVNGRFPEVYYDTGTWGKVEEETAERFDLTKNIYLVALDVSSEAIEGKYCGQGGYREPDGGMVLIPASGWCFEESDVTVHELGHAFGLLHDFRNGLKPWIDLYSTEPMTNSRCANEWLDAHRYFNVHQTYTFDEPTTIDMGSVSTPRADSIRLRFEITDRDGLRQAQLFTTVAYLNASDLGIFDCKTLNGSSSTVEFVVPISALVYRGEITLRVIDTHGNFTAQWYPVDITPFLPPPQVVNLPDANLRAKIEKALGKASGAAITTADMASLTILEFLNAGISDLTGFEGTTNLTGLVLNYNSISDISALSGLTNLRRLDLDGNSISDISAVARLTNLRTLRVGVNSISNISAVVGLTNLRELNLGTNSISDISAVAGLTNLTVLYLDTNSISDISAVAGLTNLRTLYLHSNNISDISVIAGLSNLKELLLFNNSISDLSPLVENTGLGSGDMVNVQGNPLNSTSIHTHIPTLQRRGVTVEFDNVVTEPVNIPDPNLRAAIESALGKASGATITTAEMATLTHLEARNASISDLTGLEAATNLRYLYLGAEYVEAKGSWINSNSVSDLLPVAGLTNLTSLALGFNNISDISAVAGLTNLTELVLVGNTISNISAVSGLTNLTHLSLDTNTISDISAVSGLTNLTNLYLDANNISDISALAGLTNLIDLWLQANTISDISAVSGLTNLIALRLDANTISDISAVSGLTNLITLDLRNNSISDISAVSGLTNLIELGLDGNTIADISAVSGLTNLITLELRNNSISDISAVSGLTNLTRLWLDGNTISDISDLVANTGLGNGDTVDVGHNPLNYASINTHIPALQSRGVDVRFYNLKPTTLDFHLSVPAGISLIHVPLNVTKVDGVEQTIESIADLYDVLGGAGVVTFLITYDPATGDWLSYFGTSDRSTAPDRTLTDEMGIIANLVAPTTVLLTGNALGTDGSSTITLTPGLNLVGLPLNDSSVTRVSDLFALDGIKGNVPVIILNDGGEFKTVGQAGDPGDIEITGGQSFILTAQRAATVTISGEAWAYEGEAWAYEGEVWANDSEAAAAPPVTLKGVEVEDTTPVLGLRGAIVDEGTSKTVSNFRVTVKNLSTGKSITGMTRDERDDYRLTVVDIETGRVATIGDILEISAQSPNPFIGVEPVRYTVTMEDVKRSLIQLPALVAYEIPAETQLLSNYPNPFNPETWIPYRLAADAFVTLTIYDSKGRIVRTIDVGHQIAAVYESRSKAIYWDGRNNVGEQVASGVFFYHLSAGDYSATRKMVILK